jgi:hypothetical protein
MPLQNTRIIYIEIAALEAAFGNNLAPPPEQKKQ